MYIKQIEIDNFKSFATETTIPLMKGFTTIVGPNGSGKSNIIDAVLFALGLQQARSLRAEKLEDLVSIYTKRNDAFVKVIFADCENGTELSIARRIKKSTQGYNSTYYLNDKPTTHTEIMLELEKYNVTPNSYNVVMQGDIMSIINTTYNERRKLIDEIAGVGEFNRQIGQAKDKLDSVEVSIKNSTIKLGEVETRLSQLKEEKEVALKYQKLKDEKTNLESQVTTVKFFDIKNKLEQAHTNILTFQKKEKEEKVKAKDLDERVKLVKEQYEQAAATVREKGEAHLIDMQEKLSECKNEVARKENAITFEEKNILEKKQTIENANNGIASNNSQIELAKQTIKSRNVDIKVTEEELAKQRAERDRITKDLMGVNDNIDQQIKKREDLRKELDALKDKETNVFKQQLPLETELKTINEKLTAAKKSMQNYDNLKLEFDDKKDLLELQIEQLTKEQNDYKIIQQNAVYELEKLENEIKDMEYDVMAARRQIMKMEANKDAREQQSGNRAVQIIENANIRGVHAPLYQLGNVDKEYSTALEVAVGGRMGNLVVDDPKVAQTVFEIIRSSGGGRLTCLPLSKMQKAPTSLNLPRDNGVIDYAINLIDFDDMYLDAFFYAVRDTIIVEDNIIAQKLQGKYRMVTLDGTLYEKTGAMTGGGKLQSGFKFAVNDDDSEIEKYKKRLLEMEEKYKSAVSKKKNLEEKRQKAREDYSSAMNELNKANIELNSLKTSFESSKTTYTQNEEFIKLSQPEIERITKELDKLEEQNISLSEDMLKLQERIDEIEQLLDNSDLQKLKDLTQGIEDEISRLNSKKLEYENEIKSQEMKITFHNTAIENNKEQIENSNKSIAESEKNIKLFQEDVKTQKVKVEELEAQVAEIKEKLDDFMRERDGIHQKLIDLQTKQGLKVKDLENIAEQIESFKARRREIEPQLEVARQDLIDAGVEIEKLEPVKISIEELTAKIQRLGKRMDELGNVNMNAIQQFEEVSDREKELKEQIDTLTKERQGIIDRMNGYEQLKKDAFMTTYDNINANFKELYHQLSGGEGSLILENEKDPFAGGLDIEAKPGDKPRVKLKGLSGGEKSVAASALIFAIQKFSPAPFYALDEVDAALDPMNIDKLADMVHTQSKQVQFVVVSHRKPMVEVSDRTFGVTQEKKGKSLVTGGFIINEAELTD